jgi:hypothetical protein
MCGYLIEGRLLFFFTPQFGRYPPAVVQLIPFLSSFSFCVGVSPQLCNLCISGPCVVLSQLFQSRVSKLDYFLSKLYAKC